MTQTDGSRLAKLARESVHLGLIIVGILAARQTLADHYFVPSGSMENTLFAGDRVLVDKRAYGYRIPFTNIDVVRANPVLTIGDHRGRSADGRYFGTVPEREIYGRAVAIYYRRGDGFSWQPL